MTIMDFIKFIIDFRLDKFNKEITLEIIKTNFLGKCENSEGI